MDTDHLPPAVVFDCDGTLADTESVADQAWQDALLVHGYEATRADLEAVLGRPWPYCWAYFSGRYQLGGEAEFRSLINARYIEHLEDGLELYHDALDTMRALAAGGVRIAVASSSRHRDVVGILARAEVSECVSAIVAQEDVARHKPEPEPYLEAARLLGVDPSICVALEDSPVGVAAAVAAGMYTVGVLRRSASPDTLSAAHRVVDRVTVDALVPARGTTHR